MDTQEGDDQTIFEDLPKYEHYERSFVAFLDILGFTARVRQLKTDTDFHNVAGVLYALKKNAESFTTSQKSFEKDVVVSAVSDSVIVTMPYRSPVALYFVLSLIHQLQYDVLLAAETPIRGYIAEGHVYHRNGIIFGPGYLDAYQGEVRTGGPPRVVLAPAIAAKAVELTITAHGDGRHSVLDLLRRDADGHYFVDYLKPISVLSERPLGDRIQELGTIAGFARAEVERHEANSETQTKYRWLIGYIDVIRREFYSSAPSIDAGDA